MDVKERIQYWVEISEYDLETAKAMLVSNRYLYVGFMCHQSVEKIIKAYFTKVKQDSPPYIHNLKRLAELCELYTEFSDYQLDIIEELIPMNIEARYPTYKEHLLKTLTKSSCSELISKTEELCQWIKKKL